MSGRAPPSPGPVLAATRAVSRRYRQGEGTVPALDRVTLTLAPGEWVALCGPSGCGKSTLLNLLAGVDRCDEGEIEVCGLRLDLAGEKERTFLRRRCVGTVYQAFHLLPHLTVEENVALPLALAGRRDPARVRDLLARVGLARRARHHPSEISGGEQQRAAVARALVHRPPLLLADEPTGNLDSENGAAILDLLASLRREEGAGILLATHDPRARAAADRTIALRDGRIVEGTE